jgi:hypothetical protein
MVVKLMGMHLLLRWSLFILNEGGFVLTFTDINE